MTKKDDMIDILVVDDDETDRMAIRRNLSRPHLKFRVNEAATGEAAAELIARQRFDCIFLDYGLPDMDGVTLLKRLYNIDTDELPAPVVMLTGQGSEGVMADALRWGAHDYISKDNISIDTILIGLAKAREMFDLRRNRRYADEKLRHAQKMDAVGQLTSGIAHDFNNLLTVILSNTHLLRRKLAKAESGALADIVAPKVEAIDLAARRGADLVKHLMIFTRQRALEEKVIDLGRSLPETVEMLRRTLGGQIELSTDFFPEPSFVSVDATQLANAIINIALNARDAMPRGGKLAISSRNIAFGERESQALDMPAGSYVMVSIEDNGTGMPENVRQRIFEPFYTTKPAGEGTGLGLSMVYGFIRQSGGHIQVDSEEGHGTVFRIYLPLCPGEAGQNSKENANAG